MIAEALPATSFSESFIDAHRGYVEATKNELAQLYVPLVDHIAGLYISRFPHLDFEELQSTGMYWLSKALCENWWDPNEGRRGADKRNNVVIKPGMEYRLGKGDSLSTFLYRLIHGRLADGIRESAIQRKKTPKTTYSDFATIASDTSNRWKLEEFICELSDDARTIVKLCVDTPKELQKIINDKGGTAGNYRSSVRQWLKDKAGWSTARIREGINEVQSAVLA